MSEIRNLRRASKTSELLAREIIYDVERRNLKAGNVLPSETAMLSQYGVSRGSLREALRILETHGLVSMKPGPGGGPVLETVNPKDFGRMATFYFRLEGATFGELLEALAVVEPVYARLAAQRCASGLTDQRMRIALEETTEMSVSNQDRYTQSARSFHSIIASSSGNKILDIFGQALREIFTDRVGTAALYPQRHRELVRKEHMEIAAAILAGKEQRAHTLMLKHSVGLAEYVKRNHPRLFKEVVDWV